jgi:hypothetical protein
MSFFTPQISELGISVEVPFAVIGLALMIVGLFSLRFQDAGRQRGGSGPSYGRGAAQTGLLLEISG